MGNIEHYKGDECVTTLLAEGTANHIAGLEAKVARWQDEAQKLRVALDRAQTDRRGGRRGIG